jgi:small basic protein
MIFVPVIAILIGAGLALLFIGPQKGIQGQYIAVAFLAGFDTVCGGIRSGLEGKFNNDVFITGFISNIVIAFTLAWLGDKIFIDLFLAVALVLGARIFTNLSLIRRILLTKLQDARERRKLQERAQAAQVQSETTA